MAKVEIYATPSCSYCMRAKQLLLAKGLEFTEIDVFNEPRRRVEMVERSGGGKSVPQIFIDGAPIGGYSDLQALEDAGRLDKLLAAE